MFIRFFSLNFKSCFNHLWMVSSDKLTPLANLVTGNPNSSINFLTRSFKCLSFTSLNLQINSQVGRSDDKKNIFLLLLPLHKINKIKISKISIRKLYIKTCQ